MAYPFEYTVKHRPYEFTFLNVILMNMTFGGNVQEKYQGFKTFIQQAFKLELTPERFGEIDAKPIQISSNDKVFKWTFFGNTVRLQISGEVYVSYDKTLKPLLEVCDALLDCIGEKCVGTFLQKVNLFPLEQSNRDEVHRILDNVVLSDKLIKIRQEKPYVDEVKLSLYKNSFSNEDGENQADIVTGFIVEDAEDNSPSRIILDISASEVNPGGLLLEDSLQRINNVVDGAFFWSVKEPIVEIMENGVK